MQTQDQEKLNLLIVDDEEQILKSLNSLLHRDYNISLANSGESALDMVKQGDDPFHLIITDQKMPGMQGFNLLKQIRKITPHVVSILVTGYSDIDSIIKSINEGHVYAYVTKPWEPREFKVLVSKAAEHYRLRIHNRFLNEELVKHRDHLADLVEERTAELKQANENLQNEILAHKLTVDELDTANRKILSQHKALVEKERLKVLLETSGAAAHELNQPLMVMLGNVELLRFGNMVSEKGTQYLEKIEKSINRISAILAKIQGLHRYKVKPYPGGTDIIDIDQKENVLIIEDREGKYKKIDEMLANEFQITARRCAGLEHASELLRDCYFDLIILDYGFSDSELAAFFKHFPRF